MRVRPLLDVDDLAAVFSRSYGRHGCWTEVYAEHRATNTIGLAGGHVSEIRSDVDVGAGVRAQSARRTGYALTNVLNRGSLLAAADAAVVASGGPAGAGQPTIADLRTRRVKPVQQPTRPAVDVDAADKVTFLRRVDDAARSVSDEVFDVTATHVDVTQSIVVATSDGDVVTDERVRTRITCRVTARRGGDLQTGFDGPGVGGGLELYDGAEPEAIGRRAAQRAVGALSGVDPPSGVIPVVLGPSGGGLLLHEACGHGLEGDGIARDTSVYARSVGQQVASPLVTAVDDPSLPGAFGSYAVDDEGTDASRTLLLDAGVQQGALTDRANLAAGTRSANGRRQSYAHPPLARMSNTFILPGTSSAEGILEGLHTGVYVARLRGGEVDIATGDFAFTASEAYLVNRGEIGRRLLSVTLLGNGPRALAAVEAVADDLRFTQALCGKEDQWVPVSYGSPTLLINGLTVTGGSDA